MSNGSSQETLLRPRLPCLAHPREQHVHIEVALAFEICLHKIESIIN